MQNVLFLQSTSFIAIVIAAKIRFPLCPGAPRKSACWSLCSWKGGALALFISGVRVLGLLRFGLGGFLGWLVVF